MCVIKAGLRAMTECAKTAARERLAQARQELAARGISTRGLGRERLLDACRWVYRWGWSAPAVVDLFGGSRRGLSARAVSAGLMSETRTAAGGVLEDVPKKLLTLTDAGIAFVEKHLTEDELLEPEDALRINQANLRHDFLVQKATIKKLRSGIIADYLTPKEIAEASRKEEKIPDAIWIMQDGWKMAIELELTPKFKRKLDDFVWGIVAALTSNPPRFDSCAILSDSQAILTRYKAAFAPGKKIARWERDSQSHWRIRGWKEVPDLQKRLLFRLLSQ
jgi:hypothetical protein